MNSLLFLALILCARLFEFCEATSSDHEEEPLLLVVSYDGFKPDYLYRNVTPNLDKFRREGTTARFMNPVFPTKTFVNHFTIATGLYPGKHGVLANDVYDMEQGLLKYSYNLFHYSNETIPIWTANQMAGKHTGCMWPGADYPYNIFGKNISCTFARSFDAEFQFEDRVNTIMSWFKDPKTPINLAMLYIEEPDAQAHMYGPDSDQITNTAKKVDYLTRFIQEKLTENNLQKRVNVIHLSDHGMQSVSPPQFIYLTDFLTNGTYKMYGSSPVLQVIPTQSMFEVEIFANLTKAAEENGHFKVYNDKTIPARWRANNPRRMGPILAVADIGYGFQDLMSSAKMYEEKFNITITNETKYGVHGYDNAEPAMNAFFMAKGPLISKGKRLKEINIIDLHNLFCSILKIECAPNDGSNDSTIWRRLFAYNSNKNSDNDNDDLISRFH